MPVDSMLVAISVVAMFIVFAAVLAWADWRTRPAQLAEQQSAKRMAF